MTARRVREWPRLVGALVLIAAVLVLVGVLVASASAGGTNQSGTVSSLRAVNASQATQLTREKAMLAGLNASLRAETGRVAAARQSLAASQSAIQCWMAKAHHPRREKAVVCPAG
jgi:Tfp pilus assembly protein PilV